MSCYIITGAAGFIGSHLAEKLASQGNTIIALDNFNNFYDPSIKRKNIEIIRESLSQGASLHLYEGDIRDMDILREVLKDVKSFANAGEEIAMLHLAAMAGVRPSLQNPALYEEVNIKGTLNLLNICKEFKIERFLFASSSSIYGNSAKAPFKESDSSSEPISVYAATKKAGELMCHVYAHLYSIKTIVLRFFTVYGPRQRPDLAIHQFTKKIHNGEPIDIYGNGDSQRDYTYIDDIMDGVLKSVDRLENKNIPLTYEIYNLGESQTVKLSRLIQLIEKALDKKAAVNKMSQQPGDMFITCADISKAKQILQYAPSVTIEEGVNRFAEWFMHNRTQE